MLNVPFSMKILSFAKLVQALRQLLTTKIFLIQVSLHFLNRFKIYKLLNIVLPINHSNQFTNFSILLILRLLRKQIAVAFTKDTATVLLAVKPHL